MKISQLAIAFLFFLGFALILTAQTAPVTKTVNIPMGDVFIPFAITIHVGDSIQWINNDTDDHTIVSDDAFTTAGHKGLNHVIAGLEHNGNVPGSFKLTFHSPGKFIYYCRLHAHLNPDHQPIAPGPKGGEKDSKGNLGTPMNGSITVLPAENPQ